jgi:phage terminase small subunit
MATRGTKPKPTHLRIIEGNREHRALPVNEPKVGNKPEKPLYLKGRAAALWDEVLTFAFWLTFADSYKLAAWCESQAEFEVFRKRKMWSVAMRREHRSAGSELGFDPSSRTRLGNDPIGNRSEDPAEKYF